jgi:hypothetical protein
MRREDLQKGLYDKYKVTRVDGTDEGPDAVYFVMRLDKNGDYHAQQAMLTYLIFLSAQKNFDSQLHAGLWQLVRHHKTNTFKELGIKRKYNVEKTDGTPLDPGAKYFVIRVDQDPFAEPTLKSYASSVYPVNTKLASHVMDLAEHRVRMW